MLYQYFIDRMTKYMPMRGIRSTQIVSLVDAQLEVLGAQLMRTQVPVQLEHRDYPTFFYMPDYLFVGLSSELPDNPADAPYHCICIEDAPLPESYTSAQLQSNLIVLQMERDVPVEDMMYALNHANFILSDETRYYRGLERIEQARCRQPELPEALELICNLIVNSAAVIDIYGRVLASNSLYPFPDPRMNKQLAAGQMEQDYLNTLQQEQLYDVLRANYYQYVEIVWTFPKKSPPQTLMVPIRVRGLQAAWLVVQTTRTALHHSTIRLMEPIAGLLSTLLGRQIDARSDRSLLHSLLFQELLRAAPGQEAELRDRIGELHWRQEPGMRLLCCQGGDAAFEALQAAYPDCRWTVVGAAKLMLLYPNEARPDAALTEQLAALGLRGGISWPFDDLLQLRYAARQAETALERSNAVLTPYSRIFAAHVAAIPPEELPHFVHPAIWQLDAYDRTHESSLLPTLEAVLSGSEQLSEVADSLFIHRSTLFYRLGRIRELCGLELDKGEERMNLLLSLRLLQGCGFLPQ